MSYDLAILDKNEIPSQYVSINIDEYYHLNCIAKGKGFLLMSRMDDYYKDTTYKLSEINLLIKEITLIIADLDQNDSELRTFLIKALGLADEAIIKKKAIYGIAD